MLCLAILAGQIPAAAFAAEDTPLTEPAAAETALDEQDATETPAPAAEEEPKAPEAPAAQQPAPTGEAAPEQTPDQQPTQQPETEGSKGTEAAPTPEEQPVPPENNVEDRGEAQPEQQPAEGAGPADANSEETEEQPGDSVVTYTITFTDELGTASDETGSEITQAAEGTLVTITAKDRAEEGLLFTAWQAPEGLELADDTEEITTFTMPDSNVELAAEYAPLPEDAEALAEETFIATGTGGGAGNPDPTAVFVDGGKSFYNNRLYYKKGDQDKNFTGNEGDYIAHYNPATGTLTLNSYSGGSISVGGVKCSDITVVLKGTNTINGSLENAVGGDITVTSSDGGTLSISKTTSGSNPAIGIETGLSGSYTTGNVTIKGNAKVTINVTHNGTSTYEKAYGIFAKENITISENASVDITCATPNNTTGGGNCNGLYAAKDVTIDTNGTIKIDVTNAGKDKDNGYSYGVYHMGTATLTKVGNMEVQWKKEGNNTRYSGGAFTREATFSDTDHAINEDTTNCYASYRSGTPRKVTAGNGQLTGPGVKYENGSGYFLAGDKVNITPAIKKSWDDQEIPFKEWTSSDVTLDKSATTASNFFTVPGKDVTVTAKHSPFVGTPTFTPTGTTGTQGTLTFKTVVKPNAAQEGFRLVKEGNESSYIFINPDTTSTSSPYEYSYKTSIYSLNEGNYYVVAYLNNHYYLGEKVTVSYTIPVTTYTVRFDANGGTGTMADVTGISGSYTLPACTFTAPSDKQFKGWSTSADGSVISGTTYEVSSDTTFYAIWESKEYSITVTDGKATIGAGSEISKAAEGTAVTLTANAAPYGKVFDKWEVVSGGITLADANSATTTFTMPASAVSVKATYKTTPATTYNLTTQVNGGHGTISASKTGLTAGSTETITFNPEVGYEIDTVTVNGTATSVSGNTLNVTMNENKTVVVTYKAIKYNITVTDGKATIGAGSEISKAAEGTAVTLTANAAPSDKVFDKWEVVSGGITLADANSATTTFTMPASAVSVKATYKNAPHTHTYNQETVKPEALKTPADCTSNAVYFKSCSCGAISTTDIFVAMDTALGHAYGSDRKYDSPNHWHECSRCHDKKDEVAHDYGSDNVCDTCGYDKTVPHTHNLTLVAAKAATCTTAGNSAYYTCDGCDKWFEDATGSVEITDKTSVKIPAPGHTAGTEWKSDDTNHWHECTVAGCGVIIESTKSAHTASDWIIDTPATATTAGTKHKECTVCNKVLETETIPATHSHSYGTDWKYDDTNHWHECECGDKADIAAHSASEWIVDTAATETADGAKHKECTVCKKVLETATIPALVKIDVAKLTVAKPVKDAKAAAATTTDTAYTVTNTLWKAADGTILTVGESFNAGTVYTVKITLKAKDNNVFTADSTYNKIEGKDAAVAGGALTGDSYAYSIVLTYTFDATEGVAYNITKGANGVWVKGSTDTLSFTADGDLAKFTSVKIDGAVLAADKYTAAAGSTVITLKNEYLSTLAVGAHKIAIIYDDGDCSTNFTVHQHTYGAWSSDDTHHWHECTDASCTSIADKAEHTFEWKIDVPASQASTGTKHEECTVCGKKRNENTVIDKLPGSSSGSGSHHSSNNSNNSNNNNTGTEAAAPEAAAPAPAASAPVTTTTSARTGDSSNLIGWLAVLLISGGAAGAWYTVAKKKKEQ